MQEMVKNNELIEHTQFAGNIYGTRHAFNAFELFKYLILIVLVRVVAGYFTSLRFFLQIYICFLIQYQYIYILVHSFQVNKYINLHTLYKYSSIFRI